MDASLSEKVTFESDSDNIDSFEDDNNIIIGTPDLVSIIENDKQCDLPGIYALACNSLYTAYGGGTEVLQIIENRALSLVFDADHDSSKLKTWAFQHDETICFIHFAKDCSILFTVETNAKIHIYKQQEDQSYSLSAVHDDLDTDVYGVTVSQDERYFTVYCVNGHVALYGVEEGYLYSCCISNNCVISCDILSHDNIPEEFIVIFCDEFGHLVKYDFVSNQVLFSKNITQHLRSAYQNVTSTLLSLNKKALLVGTEAGKILICNCSNGEVVNTIDINSGLAIHHIRRIQSDDNILVAIDKMGDIHILQNFKLRQKLMYDPDNAVEISQVAIFDNYIAVAGIDTCIKVYDWRSGAFITMDENEHIINNMEVLKQDNKTYLVTGDENGDVKVWNVFQK